MDAPTPAAAVGAEAHLLSQRIAALRADIAAAREKERRIHISIATREKTLNRLQTELAYGGRSGAARPGHDY